MKVNDRIIIHSSTRADVAENTGEHGTITYCLECVGGHCYDIILDNGKKLRDVYYDNLRLEPQPSKEELLKIALRQTATHLSKMLVWARKWHDVHGSRLLPYEPRQEIKEAEVAFAKAIDLLVKEGFIND